MDKNELTREQILAMPAGLEMDALVGKWVMDWKGKNAPNYSTDIGWAWAVVEKMIVDKDGNPNKFNLIRYGFRPKNQRIRWQVMYGPGWVNLLEYAEGDTAPLAICRAALLATLEAKEYASQL